MNESIFSFDHEKDIRIGKGRIIYDPYGGIQAGKWRSPGWVLPGGGRTANKQVAETWARWIDSQKKPAVGVAR